MLLVSTMLRDLSPSDPIWHMSPQTLRKRFVLLLKSLRLAWARRRSRAIRHIAWHHYVQVEPRASSEKGKWLSSRVLEIYLQEAGVAMCTKKMSQEAQSRVASLADRFQEILRRVVFLKEHRIPERCGAHLW